MTIPNTCPDFVSHPHCLPNGNYCYTCRTSAASEEQGTSAIAEALIARGIPADVHQTGGFTMCVYIDLGEGSYIYANAEGAGLFEGEDFEGVEIIEFTEGISAEEKAEALRQVIVEKNLLSSHCGACGYYFEKNEGDSEGFHLPNLCPVA